MKKIALLLFSISVCILSQAQTPDSLKKKLSHPNNIKFNFTSTYEFSPAFVMSYERTVKPMQSFCIQAGYISFPFQLRSLPDSIKLVEKKSQSGYRIGGDYRFYFKRENKFDAPHGLYWGPYLDIFHFKNERLITAVDTSFATGTMDFTGTLGIAQVGINIGYQFVIKDRISIDLNMIGPGLAWYSATLKLNGDFDVNEENKYLQALYDYMLASFPLVSDLSNGAEVKDNGRADLFFAGFRYSISAGFRF